jgi:hypothetical protein
MFSLFQPVIWLISILQILKSQFTESREIFYQSPLLNIEFMNMTLGMLYPRNYTVQRNSAAGIIAAVCQAEKFNQKLYPSINFKGIINIAIQEYNRQDSVGQYSTMQTFKNSLFKSTTMTSLSPNEISNLAGLIGTVENGQNRINAAVGSGVSIPFINPGTVSQLNPLTGFINDNLVANRTYFSIRDTFVYSSFDVVLNLMTAYNWNIAANIFQDSVYGLSSQQVVQLYISENGTVVFPCNSILSENNFYNPAFYIRFCNCMNGVEKLTLVNVWMTPVVAYSFIIELKKNCKSADKFVFVIPGEVQPLPPQIFYNDESFKSAFIIRSAGGLDFKSFIDECLETSSPEAEKTVLKILDDVLKDAFNCYRPGTEKAKNLPLCDNGDIFKRTFECVCNDSEFDPHYNPYSVKTILKVPRL